jgi:hypothetical protein
VGVFDWSVLAKAALEWYSSCMPKRKHPRRPKDANQLAHQLVHESTGSVEHQIEAPSREQISMLMAELGRKGGKVGGKRRLETMTPNQRRDVARKAANARWKNK